MQNEAEPNGIYRFYPTIFGDHIITFFCLTLVILHTPSIHLLFFAHRLLIFSVVTKPNYQVLHTSAQNQLITFFSSSHARPHFTIHFFLPYLARNFFMSLFRYILYHVAKPNNIATFHNFFLSLAQATR